MRVVAISDTHNLHRHYTSFPTGDVLVHAGDCTTHGSEGELEEFLHWWQQQQFDHKVMVAGNHDRCLEAKPSLAGAVQDDGTHYLLNTGVMIEGRKFYGSPFTPPYLDFVFQVQLRDASAMWAQIPADTQVLVTHGPPQGIGDAMRDGHIGCPELLARVQQVRPRYHVYGHVHEGAGVRQHGPTTFMNASVHTQLWKGAPGPTYYSFDI